MGLSSALWIGQMHSVPSSELSARSQRLSHTDQYNLDRFNLAAVKVRPSAFATRQIISAMK